MSLTEAKNERIPETAQVGITFECACGCTVFYADTKRKAVPFAEDGRCYGCRGIVKR
jgi:hypothetical protein